MGIATTKSFADINEGTQVTAQIADAIYDEEGRFGPAVELSLDVLKPSAHAGETVMSTFGLSQPRRSKVRDLRADGLDDEAIATVLENKGFEFESIDDPKTPKLGGALLRIVKACYNEDARAVKKLLEECDTFDDLANALVGRRFVFTTRLDKNGYTRVDGKGEFYRVMDADLRRKQEAVAAAKEAHHKRADDGHVEEEEDADWDDIPF
jgi:hypothetical protein